MFLDFLPLVQSLLIAAYYGSNFCLVDILNIDMYFFTPSHYRDFSEGNKKGATGKKKNFTRMCPGLGSRLGCRDAILTADDMHVMWNLLAVLEYAINVRKPVATGSYWYQFVGACLQAISHGSVDGRRMYFRNKRNTIKPVPSNGIAPAWQSSFLRTGPVSELEYDRSIGNINLVLWG